VVVVDEEVEVDQVVVVVDEEVEVDQVVVVVDEEVEADQVVVVNQVVIKIKTIVNEITISNFNDKTNINNNKMNEIINKHKIKETKIRKKNIGKNNKNI